MEAIEQTINGATAVAASSGTGTVTISRNGDLVHKIYVTSSTSGITDGDSIVDEVELEIGGQRIDRHFKEWHQIWNELTTDESKSLGLKSMKGCVGSSGGTGVGMVQVPLQFWFCRNPGLALPLIALQYHEVKLKITWGTSSLVGITANCKVVADYIYLDTDERRRFAQVSHEYLIEQLQRQPADTSRSVKLNFNHPVKELIWTSNATNSYTDAQLKLNGHDRFSVQEEEYFQLRQPFDYHTAVPRQNLPTAARNTPPLLHGSDNISSLTNLVSTITLTDPGDDNADGDGDARYTSSSQIFKLMSDMAADQTLTAGTVLAIVYSDANAVTNNGTYVGTVASDTTITDNTAAQTITFDAAGLTRLGDGAVLATSGVGDTFVVLGELAGSVAAARTSQMIKKINVYSFGLKPEEHQPSGTCNFSRIDTAKLDTNAALDTSDNIYAVNYNVLRIMSGMGGLAYSN
jgi:hypothetical protein